MRTPIAVAEIGIMEKLENRGRRDKPKEYEYRYCMWEKKKSADPHAVVRMQSFLCYQDKSIEEILDTAKFTFTARRQLVTQVLDRDGDKLEVLLRAQLRAVSTYSVHLLGEHKGVECWLILNADTSRDTWFSLNEMPDQWIAGVSYQADTVRESFGSVNITNVTHGGDVEKSRELFEYIDSKARFHLPANVLG